MMSEDFCPRNLESHYEDFPKLARDRIKAAESGTVGEDIINWSHADRSFKSRLERAGVSTSMTAHSIAGIARRHGFVVYSSNFNEQADRSIKPHYTLDPRIIFVLTRGRLVDEPVADIVGDMIEQGIVSRGDYFAMMDGEGVVNPASFYEDKGSFMFNYTRGGRRMARSVPSAHFLARLANRLKVANMRIVLDDDSESMDKARDHAERFYKMGNFTDEWLMIEALEDRHIRGTLPFLEQAVSESAGRMVVQVMDFASYLCFSTRRSKRGADGSFRYLASPISHESAITLAPNKLPHADDSKLASVVDRYFYGKPPVIYGTK